jgi:hypothetical protein
MNAEPRFVRWTQAEADSWRQKVAAGTAVTVGERNSAVAYLARLCDAFAAPRAVLPPGGDPQFPRVRYQGPDASLAGREVALFGALPRPRGFDTEGLDQLAPDAAGSFALERATLFDALQKMFSELAHDVRQTGGTAAAATAAPAGSEMVGIAGAARRAVVPEYAKREGATIAENPALATWYGLVADAAAQFGARLLGYYRSGTASDAAAQAETTGLAAAAATANNLAVERVSWKAWLRAGLVFGLPAAALAAGFLMSPRGGARGRRRLAFLPMMARTGRARRRAARGHRRASGGG